MWAEKYQPKKWSNFVGNAGLIHQCKQWLKDFQNIEKGAKKVPRVLVISGPEGCGKTLAAGLLLNKAGYKVYTYGVNEIRNYKGDPGRLANFCNLYLTDLTKMGASKSRIQAHGLIVDGFEALTRADKTFNSKLSDLVSKTPSPCTPLIITTTEIIKRPSGIMKYALIVRFDRLLEKDLCRIAATIAQEENLTIDEPIAMQFAEYAFGDARQLIALMEMFYVGKNTDLSITESDVHNFLYQNDLTSNAKQCMAFEGDMSAKQTADERIIGAALGDRGNNRKDGARDAALSIMMDNSLQFVPLLMQTYPQVLLYRADRLDTHAAALDTLAQVSDIISIADMVKDESWGSDMYFDIYSCLAIEAPVKLLRANRPDDDSRRFTVSSSGYQKYYGTDNTRKNQAKIIKGLRVVDHSLVTVNDGTIGMTKALYGHMLQRDSDEEIATFLYEKQMHPKELETYSRLKGGLISEVSGDNTFSITRARIKKITKYYDELSAIRAPTVKSGEAVANHRMFKKPKTVAKTEDDIFALNW